MRAWVDALAAFGFDVRYLAASDALSGTFVHELPLKRCWRLGAEVAAIRQAARRYSADVAVTNDPIGWGVRGPKGSVHITTEHTVGKREQ